MCARLIHHNTCNIVSRFHELLIFILEFTKDDYNINFHCNLYEVSEKMSIKWCEVCKIRITGGVGGDSKITLSGCNRNQHKDLLELFYRLVFEQRSCKSYFPS